jgi:hypothetical protein
MKRREKIHELERDFDNLHESLRTDLTMVQRQATVISLEILRAKISALNLKFEDEVDVYTIGANLLAEQRETSDPKINIIEVGEVIKVLCKFGYNDEITF